MAVSEYAYFFKTAHTRLAISSAQGCKLEKHPTLNESVKFPLTVSSLFTVNATSIRYQIKYETAILSVQALQAEANNKTGVKDTEYC